MTQNKDVSVAELQNKIINREAFGKPYKWSPSDFKLGPILGKGGLGVVHIAKEKHSGLIVAIKKMSKAQILKVAREENVFREIDIHSQLKHPHILKFLTWYQDPGYFYLVVEYADGGTLIDLLEQSPNGCFSEQKAAKYIYQLADAVQYCHQRCIIHRDIKPENILVASNGDIKLADFGLSVVSPLERQRTSCGTFDYMPPEMIQRKKYYLSVDNWSIGIVLYELLVGKPPFECPTVEQTFAKILKLDFTYPEHLSEGAKDLISKLLRLSDIERIQINDVKNHYWIQQHLNSNK